jgi:hypothetical protein
MKKELLILELEKSRFAIRRDVGQLADELNFVKKFENVVRRKPSVWLAGAAATGFFLSVFRGRSAPKPKSHRAGRKSGSKEDSAAAELPAKLTLLGFLLALFKLVFPIARPLLTAYATKRMAEMALHLGVKG